MSRRPRFKRCFRVAVSPSEGVFLLSEKGQFLLSGTAYVKLAPFLNGVYTEDEIVGALKEEVSPAEVFYALGLLREEGYVVDEQPSSLGAGAAFWELLGASTEVVEKRLAEITVSIETCGEVDAAPLSANLLAMGIQLGDDAAFSVIVTDDYLRKDLQALNQKALVEKRAWMLVKPVGMKLWIGPIFVHGKTGCWDCLAHRLRGHRKVEGFLTNRGLFPEPLSVASATLPSTLQIAYGLAVTELAKWIVFGQNQVLEGKVVTLDCTSFDKEIHALVRRPQCPSCGTPRLVAEKQLQPLTLQRRQKRFMEEGGHREKRPDETYENLKHHISPITGIVGVIRRNAITQDADELAFSYVADHNFALIDDSLYFLRESLRGRSGGKGASDIQAKAGALCESIERYAGVFQGDEARCNSKMGDLEGAIHPNSCMCFSQTQFATRDQWNARKSRFNWVPEPFDEGAEIEWSPVWSLTSDCIRYLPTAYCYYGYSQQHNASYIRADANGCAAGNSLEEAILQGFMELIERDSVALWWYNRLRKPAVNLASFDEPYFARLRDYYRARGFDLWVLDITNDLDIPSFAAILRRDDADPEDIMFGFGTHFDPRIGILRAMTELNQLFPAVFAGVLDPRTGDREAMEWLKTAKVETHPYLLPDPVVAEKEQSDYPKNWTDDLHTDVLKCVEIAAERGLETLVLDQTRPDAGLHVVKVIVPGLRHFWARFGPGRLYDVPVEMGWLPKPTREADLNPHPIFL